MEIFENSFTWIKHHPVVVVGVLAAIVVLYYIAGSSSGTTQQITNAGPTDAAVNAGAQVQIAQLQANAAVNGINAQLAGQQQQDAAALEYAKIQAQVSNYQTEQAANISTAGITAQTNIQTTGIESQQAIALANDATQVQLQSLVEATSQAKVAALVDITNKPYDAQVAIDQAQLSALPGGSILQLLQKSQGAQGSSITIGGITASRSNNASAPEGIGAFASSIGSVAGALIGLL